jgi:uncharacterized protein YlaI
MVGEAIQFQAACKTCGVVTFCENRALLVEALHDGMPIEFLCMSCNQRHLATRTERERLAQILSRD